MLRRPARILILTAGLSLLGATAGVAELEAGELEKRVGHRSGSSARCLDLVILAEGYTADEKGDFFRDCDEILKRMKDKAPFKRYLALMNVACGFRPSPGSSIKSADTNYGTTRYKSSTSIGSSDGRRIGEDALEVSDEADYILILCKGYAKGGTARGRRGWVVNHGWFADVTLHELAHMIGLCADEYVATERADAMVSHLDRRSSSYTATLNRLKESWTRFKPNVTASRRRAEIPWKAWIDEDTRVPAGWFTKGVSAYEGGHYFARGIYRPRRSCSMSRDPEDFCEPCREAIVTNIHMNSSFATIEVREEPDSWQVTVQTLLPDARIEWRGIRHTGTTLRLAKSEVPSAGVTVHVVDPTDWVRGRSKRSFLDLTREVIPGRADAEPGEDAGTEPAQPEAGVEAGEGSRWRPVEAAEEASEGPVEPPEDGPVTRRELVLSDLPERSFGGPRSRRTRETRLELRRGPADDSEVVADVGNGDRLWIIGPAENGYRPVEWEGRPLWLRIKDLTVASPGMAEALGGE